MKFIPRHFSYDQPNFGRSKKEQETQPYKRSVYYWWWEFLKRNEEYERCCKNNGRGKLKDLYKDFGDIYSVDFKTWWYTDQKGTILFAEEHLPQFKVISPKDDLLELESVLYVQVPLDLPKRYLIQQFHHILDIHHKGKPGIKTNRNSTAKYKVHGHVDVTSLEKCLQAYDLKKNHPEKKLYEVAQECGLMRSSYRHIQGDELKPDLYYKKEILANTAKRVLTKSENLIKNVILGSFPNFS